MLSIQVRAAILCSAASIHDTRSPKEMEEETAFGMTAVSHISLKLLFVFTIVSID